MIFFIPLIQFGSSGVPLFMVISGMIFAMIAQGKDIYVSKFYLNRVLRIYPAFVFIVALGYFATNDPRPSSAVTDFLVALLPISNLARGYYGAFGGQLWSIAVELQYYLLFPFLLIFRRRYGLKYLYGLVGLMIFLRSAIQYFEIAPVQPMAFFSIFGNLEIFIAGWLLAELFLNKGDFSAWWQAPWVLPIYVILLNVGLKLAFNHQTSYFWVFWPTFHALMWAGFVAIYLKTRLRIPFSDFLAKLGKYSYSIFIWHIFVIAALQNYFKWATPYTFGFFVVLPVTCVIAAISYNLIERPFLELRVKYTQPLKDQRVDETSGEDVMLKPENEEITSKRQAQRLSKA